MQNPQDLPPRKSEYLRPWLLCPVHTILFRTFARKVTLRDQRTVFETRQWAQCVQSIGHVPGGKKAFVLTTGHFSVAFQRTCTSGLRAVAIYADAWGPTVRRKLVVFQILRKTHFVRVTLSFRCTISPRQLKRNGLRRRRRRHVPSERPVLEHPQFAIFP